MTLVEMHTAIKVQLQQVAAEINDDFLSGEIDVYLNRAQLSVVKSRVNQGEQGSQAEDDIRTLLHEDFLLPLIDKTAFPTGSDYEYLCPYPDDFLSYLGSEAGLTRSANPTISSKEYVPCRRIGTGDELERYRVTTFHKPYLREPRILLRDDFLHLFCDHETTLVDAKVIFVRKPQELALDESDSSNNVESELPEHVHDEIVETALKLMLRDLNSTPSQ